MKIPGDLNIQGLAAFGGLQEKGEGAALPTARMFDTDGDGRTDLFLIDFDNDGVVDGAVKAFDLDGDGVSETFVQYNEAGEIHAVGLLDPETRELEVLTEEADNFENFLSTSGLEEAHAPDGALFTAFDDPYFIDSFGTAGEAVPEAFDEPGEFADISLTEVDGQHLESLETGASLESGEESPAQSEAVSGAEEPDSSLREVTPQVVEIEDYSGAGDGSDLHAKIDQDGDGLADDDQRLSRTSDGTWHGDVDRNGYSEEVAFDRDQDGHIESVDTTGRGSSADRAGAEQVVAPESGDIVDIRPGDDDFQAGETAAVTIIQMDDESSPAEEDADSSDDADSTYDAGISSGPDPGESDNASDADAGSTTLDSDSSGSGGADVDNT